MAPPSSIVARWELACRLKARRKGLGIDHKTIADRLEFSRNYWSAVENERTLLSSDKLDEVISLFEFDDEAADKLRQLREIARSGGWWGSHTGRYDENTIRLFALEHGCVSVRAYDALTVPGLLQTEEYARSLFELDPLNSTLQVDNALGVRLQRQQRLTSDDPVQYSALLSEAVIVQRWADPETHLAQLRHLVHMSERDNVQLRVLPFDDPPGIIGNSSTLVFFSFESPFLPTAAFQEAVRLFDPVYDGSLEFRRLELCWNEGRRRALSPEASAQRIDAAISAM